MDDQTAYLRKTLIDWLAARLDQVPAEAFSEELMSEVEEVEEPPRDLTTDAAAPPIVIGFMTKVMTVDPTRIEPRDYGRVQGERIIALS